MNIGNIKANAEGTFIGRIVTLQFSATIALREVNSSNEKAPAYDIMALTADRRSWVKIGALWEYNSNDTGEVFLSGRVDDPSLDKPLDIAMFQQDDGSYNVSWRRPRNKRALPTANASEDSLPPMPPMGDGTDEQGATAPAAGGDGLGESTAPAPRGKAKAKDNAKETEDVPFN